jgi:uncharacterized membrane protein
LSLSSIPLQILHVTSQCNQRINIIKKYTIKAESLTKWLRAKKKCRASDEDAGAGGGGGGGAGAAEGGGGQGDE